uniref:J domain-containing protein n=1 Tax=Kalanchoe fedtschenkoi TaxID=63787 RepID=A0A7N0TJU8_KALFE
MDSNKDEALRCIAIAKGAIAAGNKKRALKFIGIASRLNSDLQVDGLLEACEKLESTSSASPEKRRNADANGASSSAKDEISTGERSYSEEHVQVISQIKKNNDYYAVLGLEKSCTIEEIRKAYKKLSLKVHPDKNKAPGSEEAFKKVSKAFKCLSDESSRMQYDQTGLVEDFESNQHHHVRRRRTRTQHSFYDDEFDPDEIFRAFFGQRDMFRSSHVYRTGRGAQPQENHQDKGPNLMILLQILPFIIIFLLAYLPFSEPEYSLQKTYNYQVPITTEKYGIEYFVKSLEFEENFPTGSPARENIEEHVVKDYKHMLGRYCHIELQRRQWSRNLPTPHCDKLRNLGVV